MEILFWVQFLLLLIFLFVSFINFFTAPIFAASKVANSKTLISVLVPARNEEKNIANCIQSVLQQDYKNFEIIVLDDESNDRTVEIVNSIQQRNSQVKLLHGKPLPENWTGKNWACYQLSKEANGKYFLFIDADVILSKSALSSSFFQLEKYRTKALSVFPTQIIKSFGERLITPLMNWILLTLLPLKLVYKSKNKSFLAANGQFFLIESELYHKIGGHEKVKSEIVEDMALARNVKTIGEKFVVGLGGNQIFCRMYASFSEGVAGFSKNFYKGFALKPIVFFLFLIFLEFVFLLPIIFSFFDFRYTYLSLMILTIQIIVLQISRMNLLISILHPVQMLVLFYVGIKSMFDSINGNLTWKNRKLS